MNDLQQGIVAWFDADQGWAAARERTASVFHSRGDACWTQAGPIAALRFTNRTGVQKECLVDPAPHLIHLRNMLKTFRDANGEPAYKKTVFG